MLKSKCAAFRRSKRVKVSSSPEGKPRFYKSVRRWQNKIHYSISCRQKALAFSDMEKQTIGKTDDVKSLAARQAWKRDIEEAVSIIAAAFGRTLCELGTKMAICFLSGWIFHWWNGAR
jgi:hypothetical protein